MLIGSRSGMMVKNKPNLPYDSEIEYLESTGVEYIDIGQSISNDHTIPNGAFLSCKYKTFTRNGKIIYVNERYSAANWQLRIGDYANSKPDVYFGVNVNSSYGNIGSPTASPK